jgi:hypothetical protein
VFVGAFHKKDKSKPNSNPVANQEADGAGEVSHGAMATHSLKKKPRWKIKKTAALTTAKDHQRIGSQDCLFPPLTLQVIGSRWWAGVDSA